VKVLHSISELSSLPGPLFLAIGVFDGVHLGHQAVISTSAQHAKENSGTAVVVTFDPHPVKVLRPDSAPHLITATQHKIALIRDLGVGYLLVLHFDQAFAATSPEDFVRQLVESANPLREICVGHEWAFGKGRSGNLALLKKLGVAQDFNVIGVEAVKVNGEVVSSTAIRRAIEEGNLVKATQMLGREYTILGTVVRGEQLGRKLGFPTANLSAHSEQFPPNGVYVTEARLGETLYRGVANLGFRPTVASGKPERLLELHLFDLDREIYGEEMEVRFLRYLRREQKFANVEELRAQIAADVEQARESFSILP
jgi:riboflavin kinase/FMN adenylyltransferase